MVTEGAGLKYNKLGTSDIGVSEFTLGCWPFAGGAVWGDQDDADSIAAVHASLDAGINFFDTAEGYGAGKSEEVLGKALEGRRDQAVMVTKVGDSHLSPDDVRKSCENSLSRLGTDYIDLYLIHWPNHDIPIADTMGALQALVDEGKVRALGVCNFGVRDLSDLLEVGHIEVNQLPYSLLWRPIEYEIFLKCRQHNIGLMTYSPLMQGLLTGRYANADAVPEGLARSRHFASTRPQAVHGQQGMEDELFEIIARYGEVCRRIGQPMAHVALAWVRAHEGVSSVLVGARNADEVALNLPAFDLTLPDEIVNELDDLTEGIKSNLDGSPDMWRGENRMR